MKKNMGLTERSLEDYNESNSPGELLTRAKKTLEAINTDVEAFCTEDIKKLSHEIRKIVEDFINIIKKKEKSK